MTTSRAVYEPVFRCCLFCRRLRWHGQAGGRLGHLAELRDERRSSVAMGLSPYILRTGRCMRMVAELLLGHLQTPCMLPRSISGVLGDSGGLCGPPWVKKWGHGGRLGSVWVFGPHTPRTQGYTYGATYGAIHRYVSFSVIWAFLGLLCGFGG